MPWPFSGWKPPPTPTTGACPWFRRCAPGWGTLRWVRARCLRRRPRTRHRSSTRLGDGPIPFVRPAAVGDRHPHRRGRSRSPSVPGEGGGVGGRRRDSHGQCRARSTGGAPLGCVGGNAGRRAPDGLPAPRTDGPARELDHGSHRDAHGRRPRLRRPRRHAGYRPLGPVGPAPRPARGVGSGVVDHRRLRAVRDLAGTRRAAGGNSLDNTLRVAHRVPTDWILADIRVHAIADGFGHGLVHLWSEDGTLLGTASQSTIVRSWREDPSEGTRS